MAARALAAVAARRVTGQSGLPVLASCRSAHTLPEERNADHDAAAATTTFTAEQVEAALNCKNVDGVLQDQGRAAVVLPDELVDDADAAWVPDQETGVFVPAEEAAANGPHDQPGSSSPSPSVLDQTVFVREEDMEDVERPAIDMASAAAGDAK